MVVQHWRIRIDIILRVVQRLLLVEEVQLYYHVLNCESVQVLPLVRIDRLELTIRLRKRKLLNYLLHQLSRAGDKLLVNLQFLVRV